MKPITSQTPWGKLKIRFLNPWREVHGGASH